MSSLALSSTRLTLAPASKRALSAGARMPVAPRHSGLSRHTLVLRASADRHANINASAVGAKEGYFVNVADAKTSTNFLFSGSMVMDHVEYQWGLSTIPDNVVLCLTQEGQDTHCECVFDAAEVKRIEGKYVKGRTIPLATISEAIVKARDELGWGSFNKAPKIMFTGEMLLDRKEGRELHRGEV
mmetsp:Transcript_13927/g.29760  ORF Transcript_13927/g.29760 Transcript_13927/m.29760 type:complete len:185 (-) Transcript_13927:268-822(-)|eukprot:CAMPEP_0118935158 /NCGR_PEP_ID=MMETSP1169-20130426/15017_1 /TAXON_ID=36882 /ORGANISM="Pyramimonas obovata, Strain CCMP722" /LENGTH=184 /DNA_ID=CAMNT_0006878147 /DNA_START=93 /DNA_END=647 /DNA_ORIENTATION=-